MNEASTKGWIGPLLDNRVLFLQKELQNGGRGHTFSELAKMANQAHPAKINTTEKLVQRVQFAVQNNIELKNRDDAYRITLPRAGGMTKWLEKREAERLRFVKQAESRKNYNKKLKKLGVTTLGVGKGHRSDLEDKVLPVRLCKRGHPRTPDNLFANGACKKCNTVTWAQRGKKYKKPAKRGGRVSALEAITRAQESSLDSIAEVIAKLPHALRPVMEALKETMQMEKYSKLTFSLNGTRGHVTLELAPKTEYYEV